MNEEYVKRLVSEQANVPTNQLQVSHSEEPDYYFVSLLGESGQPLIGGVSYVVSSAGKVFEISSSLPPSARLNAAKSWFTSN